MYKKAHFDIKGSLEELPDEQCRRYYRNFPSIIMLESLYLYFLYRILQIFWNSPYSFECYLYRACNWSLGPSPILVPTLRAREDVQKSFRDFRNNSLFLFNLKPISWMISSGHFWQRSSLFTVWYKNNNKQTPDNQLVCKTVSRMLI